MRARRTRGISPSLAIFWRQGTINQGGPADIMLRRAAGGVAPDNFYPGVDTTNCRTSVVDGGDPQTAISAAAQLPGINISGSAAYGQPSGSANDATTGANPSENAIAHRAVLRGNTLLVGYSYTPDLSKYNTLDDEARVIRLLDEASKIIDKNRLFLSHQCGFASCDGGNELTEEEQWAKIDQGQRLARQYWGL